MNEQQHKILKDTLEAFNDVLSTIDNWGGGDECMACGEPNTDGTCANEECLLQENAKLLFEANKVLKELEVTA